MAPSYRAGSIQEGTGNATSVAVTKPVGLAVGDWIDLTFNFFGATSVAITKPTNWIEQLRVEVTAANTKSVARLLKRADAADVAATDFTFSWTSSRAYAYEVIAVQDASDTINASAATQNASSTSQDCPSVTTTVNDCLVVCGLAPSDTISSASSSDLTLHDWVSRVDAAAAVGSTTQAVAGATGVKNVTIGTARVAGATTIAYAPAPTGVPYSLGSYRV